MQFEVEANLAKPDLRARSLASSPQTVSSGRQVPVLLTREESPTLSPCLACSGSFTNT